MFSSSISEAIDILLIGETKIDEFFFPSSELFIDGYSNYKFRSNWESRWTYVICQR